MTTPRLLMCAPDKYGLLYEINPWMHMEVQPDVALAAEQWQQLYRILTEQVGVQVELVAQADSAPDMVFTANAGLVVPGLVLLSRFRHPERQVEVPHFRAWFESNGFEGKEPPEDIFFEGEGVALFTGDGLVAGYLKRSDIRAHQWAAAELGIQVLSLELTDPRWYHLDTAFFALSATEIAYYPGAFDDYACRVLDNGFEAIKVAEKEALRFACNSIVLGDVIVVPAGCPNLQTELESRGKTVYTAEMSEFLKCGGASKCLYLFLR